MIYVAIIKSSKSFLPESDAYYNTLQRTEHYHPFFCSSLQEARNNNADVIIIFLGFIPFWKKPKNSKIICEYHSLSTGRAPKIKNILKRLLNIRADHYIFLNETVRKELFFSENISYSIRPMGFHGHQIDNRSKTKKYDIVYAGSYRKGVFEALTKLSKLGFTIVVVGIDRYDVPESILSNTENITWVGKKTIPQTYKIIQSANIGLNYTPNIYPLNIQDSTKVIEYCACRLGVITNSYSWVEKFERESNSRFLRLENIKSHADIENFSFNPGNVGDYEWNFLTKKCKLVESLDRLFT